MFKPNELEGIPIPLEQHFNDLESRIMRDIVRRIKINSEITRSADWQIYRLKEMGVLKSDIESYIKQALKLSDKELNKLYGDIIEAGYARDERIYNTPENTIIPFKENTELQQLISAVSEQTKAELKNITGSLGFAVRKNGVLKFLPIAEYYQKTLDGAMLDITSGAFDYNTVLKRIISEMTTSGLRTVDYATGWSNRIPVAARRAVMTGLGQVTGKINEDNAEQLETDLFEVTWHVGARPSHMVWQGRVFTKQQLIDVCGLGSGDGLCGWNCRHDYYPFIKGLSQRTYTDKQLEEMNAKENIPKAYRGKEYTSYTATQQQRKMETLMRKQRQDIKLLNEGGADKDTITAARIKYRITSSQYTEFSKAMDLPQQRERVYIDGLGNVVNKQGIKSIEKNKISDIIKEKSEPHKDIKELFEGSNIDYIRAEKLKKPLASDEIIKMVAGGDMTGGSCASVGLAYIGQKQGFNVLDFRGGESRDWFSSKNNKIAMWDKLGVTYMKENHFKTNISNGVKILSKVEEGKEYYLSVGKHASIVRKSEGVLQYLELQSQSKSGWKNFDGNVRYTLSKRFGCSSSSRYVETAYLTDIDEVSGNERFADILGYINTAVNKQQKGGLGNVK